MFSMIVFSVDEIAGFLFNSIIVDSDGTVSENLLPLRDSTIEVIELLLLSFLSFSSSI